MGEEPVFGVGPDHFPLTNKQRWGERMEAHTLWLQLGAELGLPGLLLLLAFYGSCWVRLLPYARGRHPPRDPRIRCLAQGIVASLVGFCVTGQFVTLEQLEIPYYLVMMGVVILKLDNDPSPYRGEGASDPLPEDMTPGGDQQENGDPWHCDNHFR
jgi:O-antigen ligase